MPSDGTLSQLTIPVLENGTITNKTYDLAGSGGGTGTVLVQTLAANATSVTFTGLPTTGDNLIGFFAEGGANYTSIDLSTAGQATLTYEAESSARKISCEIREVT